MFRHRREVHLSCIFSRIGTIMSNLGLFAGSSFMHIFISLQIWGDMPGGMVGLKPSRATWGPKQTGLQKRRTKTALFWIKQWFSLPNCHFISQKKNPADLHANFHVRQVSKRHLSGDQLPQQDGKAPHVCWPTVDLLGLLLQSYRSQESTSMSKTYWQWDAGRSAASACDLATMQSSVTVVPWLFSCSLIELCFQLYCYTRGSRQQIMSVSATVWTSVHPSLSGSSCHSGSVLRDGCLPSGATHAGEYILPGHWKENLTSAMLILAVMSSSICEHK